MATSTSGANFRVNDAFDAEIGRVLAEALSRKLEAEAYLAVDRALRVKAQDGEIEAFTLTERRGLGLRVVREGRVGYAYTESFAPEALDRVVADAATNAMLLDPEDYAGLSEFLGLAPDLDLYNPALAEVPVERKIAFALELDEVAHGADTRVKTVTGASYGESVGFVRIASTLGVDRSYRASAGWGSVQPLVAVGEQSKNYGLVRAARCFDELDAEWMAREAVRRCVEKLGAREIAGGTMSVVFSPEAFSDLIGTFASIFSGQVALEGKSLLQGRQGQRIASSAFTLVDDPLEQGGFASRPFDDEGCPSASWVLVDQGVFTGFLHNSETARRSRATTTGHASRGGYQGTLRVGTSNLVVRPGTSRREALLTASPKVLEITEITGLHAGANQISGDFSLQAQGFLHEKGERAPVHLFTVSGNFYELLEAVAQVASDLERFPSGLSTPSVLVENLAIAGK